MNFIYGVLGGAVAYIACAGIGLLIARFIGIPEGANVGVGIEPWNLPGTLIGAVIWAAIIWLTVRRRT